MAWTEDFRGTSTSTWRSPPPAPGLAAAHRLLRARRTRGAPAVDMSTVDYYNSPPGDEADRVRRQLRSWMRRMSGTLVTDLNAAPPAGP